eukprot:gene9157-biopygen11054
MAVVQAAAGGLNAKYGANGVTEDGRCYAADHKPVCNPGQGYLSSRSTILGADNTLLQLQQASKRSKEWREMFRKNPAAACTKKGSASLCAADNTDASDAYAELLMATSPQAYSSTNASQVGSVRLVAAARDQGKCQTCTAFAVAAAAETSMAAALGVPVEDCSISVQSLYFCQPKVIRSCTAGWTLPLALDQLVLRSGNFKPFFDDKRNARAVYRPAKDAIFRFGHAVVLVGYNNDHNPPYWIAKNSYGPRWGDAGFFRVAFETCSVLTADTGEAYGLLWTPKQDDFRSAALQLPVSPAGPSRPDCFWYQAQPTDYLSRVAWLAGIPLKQFMLDNVGNVKNLDASLAGVRLLLCQPAQGTYRITGSTPRTAARTDPQLESLLQIKAAMDMEGVLQSWSRQTGQNQGYCNGWVGVACDDAKLVKEIRLTNGSVGQGLAGQLPSAAALQGLPGLQVLWVTEQPGVRKSLQGDWSSLQQLREVLLFSNGLTGTLPPSWGQLKQLKHLDVYGNQLSGPLPDAYKALTALEQLIASKNSLTGTLPPSWGQLKQLKILRLWNNKLSGPLPDAYKGLMAVQALEFIENSLTGTLPPSWGQLKQLKILRLWNNKLSGPLPDAYKGLMAVQVLEFRGNSLTGTLPSSWGQLRGLQNVDLRGNQLSGPLPDAFKSLMALKELDLAVNSLTGTLPPSWGQLKQLTWLYLHSNKLSGPLPDAYKGLTAIQSLYLCRNLQLSGTVPPSWSSMKQLRKLHMHHNPKLNGCLPTSWKPTVEDVQEEALRETGLNGFC